MGEHTTIVVTYNVKDAQGATVAQTETITITGTNDAPVVASALTDTAAEGDSSFTKQPADGATDPTIGETATLTVAGVPVRGRWRPGVGDGAGGGEPVGLDADGRSDGRGVQPPGGGRAHDDRGVVQRHGRAGRDGRADRDHHHHRDQRRAGRGERADRYGGRG